MLQQVWSRFVGVISNQNSATQINFEEAYGEESIVLHSVVRVLNQIIVRVKLEDINEDSGWSVMNTSITISQQALLMSQKNVMLHQSSIALFLTTLRMLCNEHF